MKKTILVLISFFLLVSIGLFLFGQANITGSVILNVDDNALNESSLSRYHYTQAICDDDNYCQDYEIVCKGREIEGIKATGAVIQHSLDWKDPRENIQDLCWRD